MCQPFGLSVLANRSGVNSLANTEHGGCCAEKILTALVISHEGIAIQSALVDGHVH